ncbi:MAG: apolipoprotein N-acyltransferase [Bacteroidota bacterium]
MNRLKPLVAVILSGILIATSWPNLGNITPFLFIGFVPLLGLADRFENSSRGSIKFLLWTYVAFLVWNFIDTYWLFYVQGDFFTRFMSAFMPSFLNAFLMAIPWFLFFITKKRLGTVIGYLSLPAYWISYEYLHLNWDLSWPWLVIGNAFAGNINWIQWYEFTGTLGGTLWVLVANILVFTGIKQYSETRDIKRFISPVLFIILPVALSYAILGMTGEKGKREEVVIIQPNIDAYGEKFSLPFDQQLNIALSQAEKARTANTRLLLFPETALQEGCGLYSDPQTGILQLTGLWESQLEQSQSIPLMRKYLADKPQLTVLTGIPSNGLCPAGSPPTLTARPVHGTERFYDSYNTAMWLNLRQLELYHKSKLVPAAEILPFATVLKPLLGDVILDFGGSSSSLATQPFRTVFSAPSTAIKAAPVICYESIYGEFVGDYVIKGANLICVMTNDGWWDFTAGHKHHLAYSRLRAIEHRRDVVRSANTGISAHINQRGEILQSIPYDQPGVLRVNPALNEDQTFYTRFGDYIGVIAVTGLCLVIVSLVLKRFGVF